MRYFVISFFIWIIWARPFGSGFCGLRYASEHPADGSPSGPANPSRNCFILKFYLGDAFGPGYSGLALLSYCCAMNYTLRIPIADYKTQLSIESASMILALKNMLHPKIQKPVGGMRCLSRSALHAI